MLAFPVPWDCFNLQLCKFHDSSRVISNKGLSVKWVFLKSTAYSGQIFQTDHPPPEIRPQKICFCLISVVHDIQRSHIAISFKQISWSWESFVRNGLAIEVENASRRFSSQALYVVLHMLQRPAWQPRDNKGRDKCQSDMTIPKSLDHVARQALSLKF